MAYFNISQIDGVNGVVFDGPEQTLLNVVWGNFYCDGIDSIAIASVNLTSNLGYLNIYQGGQSKYANPIILSNKAQKNSTYIYSNESNLFGLSLSASDIDNDGCDDLIVGASYSSPYDTQNAGSVFHFYGSSDLAGRVSEAEDLMNGKDGFKINGQSDNEFFGENIAFSQNKKTDVNGDGLVDYVIASGSSSLHNTTANNTVYFIPGVSGRTYPANFNNSQIVDFKGSIFSLSTTTSLLGTGVTLGRFDNDGLYDILIGAPQSNNGEGQTFLYKGRIDMPSSIDLSQEIANLTVINGDGSNVMALGGAVSNLDDLNNDGVDEFSIVVSEKECQAATRSLVFYSSPKNLPTNIVYVDGNSDLPVPGFILFSDDVCNDYSDDVSTDLNNDGRKDIIKINSIDFVATVLLSLPEEGTLVLENSCNNNLCITYDHTKSGLAESLIGGFDFNADGIEDLCFTNSRLGDLNCIFGSPTWPNSPLPGSTAPMLEEVA